MFLAIVLSLVPSAVYADKRISCVLNELNGNDDFIREMRSKMKSLRAEITQLKYTTGAVYTRWGRKTCPGNKTELVYTGIAGGGHHSHSGSAAEYVCLPRDPNLIRHGKIQNPWGSSGYIFGAEYEDNFFGPNLREFDVPCAVCYTPQKTSILMVPGKTSCHRGWKKEYSGKLACGYYGHAASQYVCVDNSPEVRMNGSKNENGKLFYAVRPVCGSLPCPPYASDALMTCVVCSK